MKPSIFLLPAICLACLFSACKPDFDLNASYEDVTVVYGILNHQDSIHYVKIYRGYQSHEQNGVFINAQNPDSIYYPVDQIEAYLREYQDSVTLTPRDRIPLDWTHDFPRDAGVFYYEKERIIYYTTDSLSKDMEYKIIINHKLTGKRTEAQTPMVGDFRITSSQEIRMPESKGRVSFTKAPNTNAFGYEIHVNFLYFEVDKKTNQVVKLGRVRKNVTPRVGTEMEINSQGDYSMQFTQTFYEDIAAQLEINDNVVRYMGRPGNNGVCIEMEGWAAGESFIKFLLSNRPTNSFVQVNTIYTNLSTPGGGLAFGFLSSRVKSSARTLSASGESERELIGGARTSHLGFKPWVEYKP